MATDLDLLRRLIRKGGAVSVTGLLAAACEAEAAGEDRDSDKYKSMVEASQVLGCASDLLGKFQRPRTDAAYARIYK